LSFLETSANPYILSMGPEETATRRLNFAQAFNPIGSLTGMFVAKEVILARLDSTDEATRREILEADPEAFDAIAKADLDVIVGPYLVLGVVVALVFLVFAIAKLPRTGESGPGSMDLGGTFRRLIRNGRYRGGVVAQAFYVGAQIMCWTFIIQYAGATLGMSKEEAQGYNIIAMIIFVSSRFICTYLLHYVSPGHLLLGLAIGGGILTLGTVFLPGMIGLWSLVGISACMSLMFPTIYGIALDGLGEDAKLGSAGLILAIGGGCLMPPLQAMIIDQETFLGLMGARASFFLPAICFVLIAIYGWRSTKSSMGTRAA
ncbi:MAG: L-fucose:H+ symporter permease, partial [Verrucomicrobiota bacterium]